MNQSSSSSRSHKSPAVGSGGHGGGGSLTRYGSAPGSLLNSAGDSAIGATRDFSSLGSQPHRPQPPPRHHHPNLVGHYFTGDASSFGLDSTNCKVSSSSGPKHSDKSLLQRSYGFNEIEEEGSGASSSSLFRQRSSPAGFFNQLSSDGNGFSQGGPNRGYGGGGGGGGGGQGPSRPKSRLSFSGHQDSLSRISEVDETAINAGVASSSVSFGIDHRSWDNSSPNITFTIDEPGKRSKTTDFFTLDSQIKIGNFATTYVFATKVDIRHFSGEYYFSLNSAKRFKMARMENLLNIPEDSVACRIRAKRGCATHPRSIAERERRTRISGKLKKLQELVPNMDKQTSYADMLDLAVEHIKGLQNHVEKLQKEMERCTCGACKKHK